MTGFGAFWDAAAIRGALEDPVVRQQLAAHLLPALCLALLDERPEVRIAAAFNIMRIGPNSRSAVSALRDALRDSDEHVRKAAAIALEFIETEGEPPWFM